MSNLHKDLTDAQIHVPKGFSTAANDTKLTKDSTGALAWVADSGGGGGGVTSIVAGTGVTISPVGGTGDVTINSGGHFVSQNYKGWGSVASGSEFGFGTAQYNSEHKFTTNLGSAPITTITPKFMVASSVWTSGITGATLKNWNGWVYGSNGENVRLSLLRATLECPIPAAYPSTIPICRAATTTLLLTGNNTPVCFDISTFTACAGWTETLAQNEVLVLTADCASGETATFMLNCNITLGW